MEMKWKHILGNTWCMEGDPCIPVYLLNDREAVLFDTGYSTNREQIDTLLAEKGLRVRAAFGSHAHNDHLGNHAYYQSLGAEIILRDIEAAIACDYPLLMTAYWPGTVREMKECFDGLPVHADRTFSLADTSVEIDGRSFGLFPLPGHTPGQTGFITPDNVLYAADALLSPSVLHRAKIPTCADWCIDTETKKRLANTSFSAYILAHGGVCADIKDLIDENLADRAHRAENIFRWLQEKRTWTQEEITELFWQKLDLHAHSLFSQLIFRRNVICAMEYQIACGHVSCTMERAHRVYTVV